MHRNHDRVKTKVVCVVAMAEVARSSLHPPAQAFSSCGGLCRKPVMAADAAKMSTGHHNDISCLLSLPSLPCPLASSHIFHLRQRLHCHVLLLLLLLLPPPFLTNHHRLPLPPCPPQLQALHLPPICLPYPLSSPSLCQ